MSCACLPAGRDFSKIVGFDFLPRPDTIGYLAPGLVFILAAERRGILCQKKIKKPIQRIPWKTVPMDIAKPYSNSRWAVRPPRQDSGQASLRQAVEKSLAVSPGWNSNLVPRAPRRGVARLAEFIPHRACSGAGARRVAGGQKFLPPLDVYP